MPELALSFRALIADGTEQLRNSRVDDPRRQAMRIWTELDQRTAAQSVIDGEHPVNPAEAVRFHDAISRRARGEPLPHITGRTGFRHLALASDARALIPRPETEGLVELLLERAPTGRVADIGTGSGCIALSLALEGSYHEVTAVDLSADALALARRNRDLAAVRVSLVQADLCEPLGPDSVDALISNPPYLTADEYSSLDGSVRDWEPALALVSGGDGMAATLRLLEEGRRVVRPGGWLALEIDCSRAAATAGHASALGWSEVAVHIDLFGRERYLLAQRSNTR